MDTKGRKREPSGSKNARGTIGKSVGEYYANYIDDLVASGRYSTVSEVLRESLRLHEKAYGQKNGTDTSHP